MGGYGIVGDWGTSRLRLFRTEGGAIVDRREGPGIAALPASPEAVLRTALAEWRQRDGPAASIRLCGMIGSRNGWIDVPYVACPADRAAWRAGAASLALDGVPVTIVPGLACADGAGVADVMRGEETQIFGAIACDPALGRGRRVMILPGTHSKWVTVVDARIMAFRTFLTGELFALLRDRSTLTRIDGADGDPGDEPAGFAVGLARAGDGMLLGALFEARSAQLRSGRSRGWALGFLSGLVIGREVAEALDLMGAGPVTLVGDPQLEARYAPALAARGIAARSLDGDACAFAGLQAVASAP